MNNPAKPLWDAAAKTGERIPIGDMVVCDLCSDDYTNSTVEGGVIFESKGVCPKCSPRLLAGAEKYGELQYVKARCGDGESFADFVRRYRGPDAFIHISGIQP